MSTLKIETSLSGDSSLKKRPMKRIIEPLSIMGAKIKSRNGYLPLYFQPSHNMHGITYELPVPSAQVKSCLLLAGLFSDGDTIIIEKEKSRDHTERLLNLPLTITDDRRIIKSSRKIRIPNISMTIPGDISSAAFFIGGALMLKNSELLIENISLNPTRTGFLDVLKKMNAKLEINLVKEEPEPIGHLIVRYSTLKNIEIQKEIISNIIDEIPILAIIATQADGDFIIRNAKELRYKESDRIKMIVNNLKSLGVKIEEYDDGFYLKGPQKLAGGNIITAGDHRIAMAFTIASLITDKKIYIDNPQCAAVSFPGFFELLKSIKKQ